MENRIEKIVVNSSFGKQATSHADFEQKLLPGVRKEFSQIVGQAPQFRPAKKSISGFKLREGMVIGLRVTLRGLRARQFLEKVVNVVLPRIRDFRGLKLSGIDQQGNLTFGIKEHIVFPEIVLEESGTSFGLQVTVVPKSPMKQAEAVEFYKQLHVPFEKNI